MKLLFVWILSMFLSTPSVASVERGLDIQKYWDSSVILETTWQDGHVSDCSGFFAKDIKGTPYLWTAGHCCVSPDHQGIANSMQVLVDTPIVPKKTLLTLDSFDKGVELDESGQDLCRIPVKGLPLNLSYIGTVTPEELDINGDTLEKVVLVISRYYNEESCPKECPPISSGMILPNIGTGIGERVYTGKTAPGHSGGMVISVKTGNIIGIQVMGVFKNTKKITEKGIRPIRVINVFTYSSWYLDKLLNKRMPPLPQKVK